MHSPPVSGLPHASCPLSFQRHREEAGAAGATRDHALLTTQKLSCASCFVFPVAQRYSVPHPSFLALPFQD